jgi:hypothetical protein
VARRAGDVPVAHYWTEDSLRYSYYDCALFGFDRCNPGSDPNDGCYVDEDAGTACAEDTPMRVCAPFQEDAFGNACNWWNCGYHAEGNEYFGGCAGNATAGTLCCQ